MSSTDRLIDDVFDVYSCGRFVNKNIAINSDVQTDHMNGMQARLFFVIG